MLINAVSLFVTLSTFGLPELPFNKWVAFLITSTSALIHYCFLIYLYLKKKKFIHWNFIDIQIVLSPITLSLSLSVVIFGLNYTKYPNSDTNLLITALILFFIVGIVVPFFIYYIFLRPLQQKKKNQILQNQKKEKEQEKWKMQMEILNKCNESNESPNNIESLILVGLRITNITGLNLTPNLKRLYLTLNQIANLDGIQYVSKSLEALHLEDNQISTFTDLLPLKNFHNLTNLTLERNPIITSNEFSIPRLLSILPNLTQLNGQAIRKELYNFTMQLSQNWLNNLETKNDLISLKNYMKKKQLKKKIYKPSIQINKHGSINEDISQSNLRSQSPNTSQKIIQFNKLGKLKSKIFKNKQIAKSEKMQFKKNEEIQEPNLNFSQNISQYIATKNFACRHNINYKRSLNTSFQMNSPLQNFTNHFDRIQLGNNQLSQYKSYFNTFVNSLQNDQEEEQQQENNISWWSKFKNFNKRKFWKIRFSSFLHNN
ncbi:acidic leucine-rich nuclear phosphoprotein [Anaeramoeba flamelloides]|uniref:Acidic leucine-rich nuclear phosphoprotein n=1 Tax=Anaeramoeba flamelloides TaxID=1746091 RepID=A0ABQ8Z8F6_9EUKA|nr:acidic leucine-rich nuclear phosphoprotein [Anaeramoeba flamelloides]